MNPFIENLLVRSPRFYAALFRLKRNRNLDKLVFLSLVEQGDTVYDGGANFGYFTRLVGRRGQVHAFEPVAETFDRLQENCRSSKLQSGLILNRLALGDRCGTVSIYKPGNDSGQASLKAHAVGTWSQDPRVESITAEMVTLDSYWHEAKDLRVDFIKLDLEGAELLALRGGRKLLSQCRPILHLEVRSEFVADFGYRTEELYSFLREIGYEALHCYSDNLAESVPLSVALEREPISVSVVCWDRHRDAHRIQRLGWKDEAA